MTRDVSRFLAPDFLSLTIGIVVYFVGVLTTQRVKLLRNFSIPEPVSGGFIAGVVISLVYLVFNFEIDFDLTTRDRLLVIFFAAVGIDSRLADLVTGGRTMVVLCAISAVFVIIQNIVGTAVVPPTGYNCSAQGLPKSKSEDTHIQVAGRGHAEGPV